MVRPFSATLPRIASSPRLASVATLGAIGAVAAGSAPGATATTTRTAAQTMYTPPRAHIGDLSAGFHGYQMEMGKHGFIVTLTNISNHSVSLYGYPGLQLLDTKKHPLPTKTLWGPTWFDRNQVKRLIVLSPGETASADISFGAVIEIPADVLRFAEEVR